MGHYDDLREEMYAEQRRQKAEREARQQEARKTFKYDPLEVIVRKKAREVILIQHYIETVVEPKGWDDYKYRVQILEINKLIMLVQIHQELQESYEDPQNVCTCAQGTIKDIMDLTLEKMYNSSPTDVTQLNKLSEEVWRDLGNNKAQGRCEVCKDVVKETVADLWRLL
tara:strand:- start:31593 stop:32099 length:507 start_codon:yes stop_codon:yes gene_type:complete